MSHPLLPPYEFPADVRPLLAAAGWQPGRVADLPVALPDGLGYPPPVRALLQELGGLVVPAGGPGQTVARAGLDLHPLAAAGDCYDNGLLGHYIVQTGRALYPIGELWHDAWLVLVDLAGGVYVAANDLWQVGESVPEGLANILRGVRGAHLSTWPGARICGGLECPDGSGATADSRPGPFDASGALPADLHPEVAAVLRAHYAAHGPGACGRAHGYCLDARLLSAALDEGWSLAGAVVLRVLARHPDNPRATYPITACPSCQALFRHFGAHDAVREPAA